MYVYKHNGTQFNSVQNLTYPSGNHKFVSVTDDHQYLTVSDWDGNKVYGYEFDESEEKFK